ncbi:expressed protein [Phakopsora pachyrhizi]|uniref:Expressed protein n=1 Tax=Phakopsora pachyrhizi TaxID=170000 RepID=A0AAV0B2W8_PHAPC|nr:expressed protein [Phakopsora pachyrhizi]
MLLFWLIVGYELCLSFDPTNGLIRRHFGQNNPASNFIDIAEGIGANERINPPQVEIDAINNDDRFLNSIMVATGQIPRPDDAVGTRPTFIEGSTSRPNPAREDFDQTYSFSHRDSQDPNSELFSYVYFGDMSPTKISVESLGIPRVSILYRKSPYEGEFLLGAQQGDRIYVKMEPGFGKLKCDLFEFSAEGKGENLISQELIVSNIYMMLSYRIKPGYRYALNLSEPVLPLSTKQYLFVPHALEVFLSRSRSDGPFGRVKWNNGFLSLDHIKDYQFFGNPRLNYQIEGITQAIEVKLNNLLKTNQFRNTPPPFVITHWFT